MSGVDVIGVASGIFTLLSVTTALLDILEDISKCGARCDEFQKDLESLQGVLQHVESEYRKNIDLIEKIDESSCSKADSELTASLGRLFSTCRDLETIFKPINAKKWNINKKLAWDRSEKNLTILHRRLESQKSNLELTLRAITEESEQLRHEEQIRIQAPPPPFPSSTIKDWERDENRPSVKDDALGIAISTAVGGLVAFSDGALYLWSNLAASIRICQRGQFCYREYDWMAGAKVDLPI